MDEAKQQVPKIEPGEIIAAAGFVMIVYATFLPFTPIDGRTWRELGVGFPVLIASIFGIGFVLKQKYFAAFFIAMFAAFFVSHEIIICYDNRAVEMEKELGPDGWFRLIAMIFRDAMTMGHGSYWGIIGSSLTLLAILIRWPYQAYLENKEAARTGLLEEDLNPETDDSSQDDEAIEESQYDYVLELDEAQDKAVEAQDKADEAQDKAEEENDDEIRS
jgi:hypothetical protein